MTKKEGYMVLTKGVHKELYRSKYRFINRTEKISQKENFTLIVKSQREGWSAQT